MWDRTRKSVASLWFTSALQAASEHPQLVVQIMIMGLTIPNISPTCQGLSPFNTAFPCVLLWRNRNVQIKYHFVLIYGTTLVHCRADTITSMADNRRTDHATTCTRQLTTDDQSCLINLGSSGPASWADGDGLEGEREW